MEKQQKQLQEVEKNGVVGDEKGSEEGEIFWKRSLGYLKLTIPPSSWLDTSRLLAGGRLVSSLPPTSLLLMDRKLLSCREASLDSQS